MIGVSLRTFRRAIVGGRLRYTSFGNQPTTDDRGIYRVSQLTPGDYVIGIVTTQATVPTALQDASAAADKDGSGAEFRRQLNRSGSSGLGSVNISAGRQMDDWVLQFQSDLGMRTSPPPPGDGNRVFIYPTVYYPSTTTISSATVMTLESGDARLGVDFRLRPVITSRVSGRLAGPETEQAFTALSLLPASSEEAQRDYDMAAATTVSDRSGAFTFLGVPPGDYTDPRDQVTAATGNAIVDDDNHPDGNHHHFEQQRRASAASTDSGRADLVGTHARECGRSRSLRGERDASFRRARHRPSRVRRNHRDEANCRSVACGECDHR